MINLLQAFVNASFVDVLIFSLIWDVSYDGFPMVDEGDSFDKS